MPTEKNLTLPTIPKELLNVLNDLFPEQTPDLSMETKEIYYKIGQRSVIRFLNKKFEEQNINIMEN